MNVSSQSGRPTISVVVPCHNYGRYLAAAISSLDAQDRRPDEIFVCDDGSTDNSWDILCDVLAGRTDVTLYRHPVALGIVATFNEMVRRTSGEFVVMLSADDVLGPGFLRRMEDALEHRGLDFGYCDVACFGAEDWRFVVPELDVDRLARFNYITASSMFRRSLFDAVGGYRASFETLGFEDYDFWLTAIEQGRRGGKVPGCELRWRRHPTGSRNTVSAWSRVELRLRLFRHHPRFFLHPRTLRVFARSQSPLPGVEAPP